MITRRDGEAPPDVTDRSDTPPLIGPYTVLGRLGRGAMGTVFGAYDAKLDRKIALKLVAADSSAGTQGHARLLREAQSLARVSHPNVVQIYEVGEHHHEVYIAMEFVRGETLRSWTQAKPRTWREILEVFVLAGRGLAAAHAAGVVHRDFKPDNAMVGDDGRVRVMDFGLARPVSEPPASEPELAALVATDGALALTTAGARIGTPAYMDHPELAASLSNLANVRYARGDYAGAKALNTRALAITEKALGSDHPDLALILGNLAAVLERLREYPEAAALGERALAITEKSLGPAHVNVGIALKNLANIRFLTGDRAEARTLYQRSLAVLEPSDPTTPPSRRPSRVSPNSRCSRGDPPRS